MARPPSIETYLRHVEHGDPRQRAQAQLALPAFPLPPRVAQDIVRRGLTDQFIAVRRAALRSLESRPYLARAMFADLLEVFAKERSSKVRFQCELALYSGGPPRSEHLPRLVELLSHRREDVVRTAAELLRQMGPEAQAAAEALAHRALHDSGPAAESAERALIAIAGKGAWWTLVGSKRSDDEMRRRL